MFFNIPVEVNLIISKLEQYGFEAWLVGGCVRDFLMGIMPEDYDICTSALPEQITPLFEKTLSTGIKHGTITVIINHYCVEVTTFRVDSSYTDHRRPDSVIFSRSLVEDLKRRDFTINSIAYHPTKGIIDPYNGQKDIATGIIRTVGDPIERFKEDSLRMLRAIRFKTRFNFDIHIKTKNAITLLANTIEFVSNERILAEINKILTNPHPEAFIALFDLELIKYIFPVPIQSLPNMEPFNMLNKKLSLRWSALLWQMGFCDYTGDTSDIGDLSDSDDINDIETICHKLKMSNTMAKEISAITSILACPLPDNYYSIRLLMSSVAPHLINDSLNILRSYGLSVLKINKIEKAMKIIIKNKHCIRLSDLALDGNDLIDCGFLPGKSMGELLEMLFLCVLQKPELNRKDILLVFADCISSGFDSKATH